MTQPEQPSPPATIPVLTTWTTRGVFAAAYLTLSFTLAYYELFTWRGLRLLATVGSAALVNSDLVSGLAIGIAPSLLALLLFLRAIGSRTWSTSAIWVALGVLAYTVSTTGAGIALIWRVVSANGEPMSWGDIAQMFRAAVPSILLASALQAAALVLMVRPPHPSLDAVNNALVIGGIWLLLQAGIIYVSAAGTTTHVWTLIPLSEWSLARLGVGLAMLVAGVRRDRKLLRWLSDVGAGKDSQWKLTNSAPTNVNAELLVLFGQNPLDHDATLVVSDAQSEKEVATFFSNATANRKALIATRIRNSVLCAATLVCAIVVTSAMVLLAFR